MICPKCGHERSDKDDPEIPDYECLRCGVIYAKYITSNTAYVDVKKLSDSDLKKLDKIRKKSASFNRVKKGKINQQKIALKNDAFFEQIKILFGIGIEYVFWFIVAASIFSYIFMGSNTDNTYTPKTIKIPHVKSHQENINTGFNARDGSHKQLVTLVKKGMNDPSSFDHVETRYIDNGNGTLNVLMKYRGKNAFGAVVLDSVKVRTDIDSGNVIGLIE